MHIEITSANFHRRQKVEDITLYQGYPIQQVIREVDTCSVEFDISDEQLELMNKQSVSCTDPCLIRFQIELLATSLAVTPKGHGLGGVLRVEAEGPAKAVFARIAEPGEIDISELLKSIEKNKDLNRFTGMEIDEA